MTVPQISHIAAHLHTLLPPSRTSLSQEVIPKLLASISQIANQLRTAHHVSQTKSTNPFGDEQLNVDILAEQEIRSAISNCAAIVTASSEEIPREDPVVHGSKRDGRGPESYTVAFDPLDGSSIIAPNWTVGTIIGIWDGATALDQDPRTNLVAAILGVLGPRTSAIVAVRISESSQPICIEVGISPSGDVELVRENVELLAGPFKTRYFAPANLRAAAEDEKYMSLINYFILNKYTLRYSGGLVPDVVHALVKGHGVYISPVTAVSKAKLRRLYELAPIALVVECAGGEAVDEKGVRVLDRKIENVEERAGLICGTRETVELVRRMLVDG